MSYAMNCNSGVFGRTIFLINFSSRHKLIYVCVIVQMKYVPFIFLRGYRATELRVNVLKKY